MSTSCFFCAAKHGLSEREYAIPLCQACRQMKRFQILLLQHLFFMQVSLDEIQEAVYSKAKTSTVVPDGQEG